MKAFEEWYNEFEEPVNFDEDWFRYEAGWKAALEWVKREAISLDERGDVSRNVINRELEI